MNLPEVETLCRALESLLKPDVDNATRLESLRLYESYKENGKCAEVGFYLAGNMSLPANVRHYGLLLVKHRVRMQWTSMEQTEQVAIKTQLLDTISNCSETEPFYIKSMLASILNELVKHVWPQNWPTMQDEVINIFYIHGNATTIEIVILMFQNLAEDVAVFENIETKPRARDLRKALSVASSDVVTLLLKTLREHAALADTEGTAIHAHFVELTISALEGYIGWVSPEVLFMDKGILFETLIVLFESENFQEIAAECFLIAVSRRGPIPERIVMLKLTDNYFVEKYASALKHASRAEGFNQNRFHFLNTMGRVITSLCTLIISIWDDESKDSGRPNELRSRKGFLEVLFDLTCHESKCVSYSVSQCWARFFQHREIAKDPTLLELLPMLVDIATQNLTKDFSKKNMFSSFEDAELNDDEEFASILQKNRANMVELLRFCTILSPIETLEKCYKYTEVKLNTKYESVDEMNVQYDGLETLLSTALGSVVQAVEDHDKTHLLPLEYTENLLKVILALKPEDPRTLQTLLSCVTSLCKVLSLAPCPQYHFKYFVDHLFMLLDKTADSQMQPGISKLRLFICVTNVRLAKLFPKIMAGFADHFKACVQERLNQTPCKLSPSEKVSLLETLVMVSMEWEDVSQQSQLISDVMNTALPIVHSPDFISCLQSPEEFAEKIGMGDVPPDIVEEKLLPCAKLRSDIYYYTCITLAVVNRSQVWKIGEETNSEVRNPCSAHLGPAFDHILSLVNLMTAMWSPQSRNFIHPENLKALGLRESEKVDLISYARHAPSERNNPEPKPRLHWEILQSFLIGRLDCCYQVLGLFGKTLGSEFYRVNGLQHIISIKVLSNIESLSPPRVKLLLRLFLSPFFKNCPEELVQEVLSPLLQKYCQFVMNKLHPIWEAYSQKQAERLRGCDSDHEEREVEEILEEQILRTLTREHLDLLVSLCVNKSPRPSRKTATEDPATCELNKDITMRTMEGGYVVQLSSLGVAIANSSACENVFVSALTSLSWHDTASCYKATQLLWPLMKLLTQNQKDLFNEEITKFVLRAILLGLKRHGENAGCEAQLSLLALMVIQTFKDRHENAIAGVIHSAMRNGSGENVKDFLVKFDSLNHRKRKTQFKRFVSEIVDYHVGQQFKVIPEMEIFAPLFIRRRRKIEDEGCYDGLSSLFKPDSENKA